MVWIRNGYLYHTYVFCNQQHNIDTFHPQCDGGLPDSYVGIVQNNPLRNILVQGTLVKEVTNFSSVCFNQ